MKQAGTGILALAGVALLGSDGADAQSRQVVTGPVSTYWMTARTTSGMGAGMASGPSVGAIAGMMMGRTPSHVQTLELQLGTTRKAAGEPAAEHLPPSVLKAGQSLPLVTPKAQSASRDAKPYQYGPMEKPKGKMLIYWGCGEKARPGQPIEIDFAKLVAGQVPPAFSSVNIRGQTPPSATRFTTFGEWPNSKTRTTVPADGSLVGEHVVRGNYTNDIRFTLASGQDFLAPLALTSNAAVASGANKLGWKSVPGAKAYFAYTMGSSQGSETMVFWSSSEVRLPGMAVPDFMEQGELQRLVANKTLLSPQATECVVPAEVVRAAPQSMLQLQAFGGEANFSHPPRPADPKVAWNIDWTAKVRMKSTYSGMLGMEMPDMAGGDASDGSTQTAEEAKPKKKKSLLKGLGSIINPIP